VRRRTDEERTVHDDPQAQYFSLLSQPPDPRRDDAFVAHTDALLHRQPGVVDRLDVAELWYERAQAMSRLGRHDEAIAAMETALEVGWDPVPDGRCDLATLLVTAGRVEQAYALHEEVHAETPDDVWFYNSAGLDCVDAGDDERALGWFTEGVEVAQRVRDPDRVLPQLLELRSECLARLGRDPDEVQRAAAALPPDRLKTPPSPPEAVRGDGSQIAFAIASFATAEELAEALAAWPELAEHVPTTFPEYCRGTEAHLKAYARGGVRVSVAPVRVAALRRWAADRDLDPGSPEARSQYAADLLRLGGAVAWPPARNEPCWCGSGRKYKKCCGPQPPAIS
jgi:tetratricopeptide (TPR) repeat protein